MGAGRQFRYISKTLNSDNPLEPAEIWGITVTEPDQPKRYFEAKIPVSVFGLSTIEDIEAMVRSSIDKSL